MGYSASDGNKSSANRHVRYALRLRAAWRPGNGGHSHSLSPLVQVQCSSRDLPPSIPVEGHLIGICNVHKATLTF